MIYKKILAVIVVAVVAWIVWVFYNVGREGVILKWDKIRSKWKILLFWFVLIAVVLVVWYYLVEWGIID